MVSMGFLSNARAMEVVNHYRVTSVTVGALGCRISVPRNCRVGQWDHDGPPSQPSSRARKVSTRSLTSSGASWAIQ